jgi:hypothetical protein
MFTLLIFSRNDTKNALDLADSLHGVADEVIVIDSSDKEEHETLAKEAKKRGINVYYTIPLGYVEPLRPYGVSKCKNEWVLYLDTDERLNEEFAKSINGIIANGKCDAFAIKRYEEASPNGHTAFFTWQIRLFKKSKVSFKGIIHEQPAVHGRLCTLGDAYYIEHRTDLMHHSTNDYGKMNLFEVLSYADYNDIVLDYVRKLFALDTKTLKARLLLGFASLLLNAYELVLLKKEDQELARRDYQWFYFIRTLAYSFRQRRLGSLSEIWNGQKKYLAYIEEERAKLAKEYGITRQDLFEISKILNRQGVIKYLGLDKPENVDLLTRKYDSKAKGIDFTIRLIVERYKEGKR